MSKKIATLLPFLEIVTQNATYKVVASGKEVNWQGSVWSPLDITVKDMSLKSSGSKDKNDGYSLLVPLDSQLARDIREEEDQNEITAMFHFAEVDPTQPVNSSPAFFQYPAFLNGTTVSNHELLVGFTGLRSRLQSESLSLSFSNVCPHSVYKEGCEAIKTVFHVPVISVIPTAGTDMALLSLSTSLLDTVTTVNTTSGAVVSSPVNATATVHNGTAFIYGKCIMDGSTSTATVPITATKEALLQGTASWLSPEGITMHSRILYVDDPLVTNRNGIVVSPAPDPAIAGGIVDVTLGCDLSFKTCANAFSNAPRFGGFPFFIGKENPFKGSYLD